MKQANFDTFVGVTDYPHDMKKILIVGALLAMPVASASYVDFMYAGSDGGQNSIYGVSQKGGIFFVTDWKEMPESSSGVKSSSLSAYKFGSPFTASDLNTIGAEAFSMAQKCYNSDSSRLKEIQNWLLNSKLQYQLPQGSVFRTDSRSFGPVDMHFIKYKKAEAYSITIDMSRAGEPGIGIWKNHCVLSG